MTAETHAPPALRSPSAGAQSSHGTERHVSRRLWDAPQQPGRHSAGRVMLREKRAFEELAQRNAVAADFEVDSATLPRMWWHLARAAQYDFTPEEMTRLDPASVYSLCRHYRIAVPRIPEGQIQAYLDKLASGAIPAQPSETPPPMQGARSASQPAASYSHLTYSKHRTIPHVPRNPQSDLPSLTHRRQTDATRRGRAAKG